MTFITLIARFADAAKLPIFRQTGYFFIAAVTFLVYC